MLRVVLKPLISDIPLIGGVQVSFLTHIRDLDPDLDTTDPDLDTTDPDPQHCLRACVRCFCVKLKVKKHFLEAHENMISGF